MFASRLLMLMLRVSATESSCSGAKDVCGCIAEGIAAVADAEDDDECAAKDWL